MNRRGFLEFLIAAPVAVPSAVAAASAPRDTLGDFIRSCDRGDIWRRVRVLPWVKEPARNWRIPQALLRELHRSNFALKPEFVLRTSKAKRGSA